MGCRIGMTTNLSEREAFWKSKYPKMTNWQVLSVHETKSEAQKAENNLAKKHGCDSSPGGDGPERAKWYVYGFNY